MKRKAKRFNEGGYEATDDYKNLEAAAAREKADYEESLSKAPGVPLKMASFKEAFAEARKAGDKTFEYMGKKYTTDLAKPKAALKMEAVEAPKGRSFADKQEAASEKMRGAYKGVAENLKKAFTPTADNPRIRRELTDIRTNMKKGGTVKSSASKRADGIAQRGKTRGKMV